MIRLNELREEKNLKQRVLAKNLNICQGTYHNWESGKTEPSITQLIQIAKFFDVSVDYLIGNSDEIGIINIDKKISKEEELLLNYYNNVNENARKAILDLVKSISESN